MTPFRGSARTLTRLPDCSITVLRLSSTLRLLSKVSASLKRLMSPVMALVRNGAKIFASKSTLYWLVQVSCWVLLDEPNTYINTFAQGRCTRQSDNCIGSRTSILKEVNKNFPYFWVIRSGTGLEYPFAYQPCYAPFDNRIAKSILRSMQKS
jgi:hypothetical protein